MIEEGRGYSQAYWDEPGSGMLVLEVEWICWNASTAMQPQNLADQAPLLSFLSFFSLALFFPSVSSVFLFSSFAPALDHPRSRTNTGLRTGDICFPLLLCLAKAQLSTSTLCSKLNSAVGVESLCNGVLWLASQPLCGVCSGDWELTELYYRKFRAYLPPGLWKSIYI